MPDAFRAFPCVLLFRRSAVPPFRLYSTNVLRPTRFFLACSNDRPRLLLLLYNNPLDSALNDLPLRLLIADMQVASEKDRTVVALQHHFREACDDSSQDRRRTGKEAE